MSEKSNPLRLLGLLAVLALTFFTGRWSVRTEPRPAATRDRSVAPLPATPESAAQPAPVPVPLATAAVPLRDSAYFARLAARSAGSFGAEDERQRAIEQWAEIDPRAALEFARTQLKGDRQAQAISTVIALWGKQDPAAAWTWVSTEMPTATHHFDTLLEVFGKNSTELARQYAGAYTLAHPEAALEVNLAALLGVTYRGDFAGARAYIERAAALDPELRANLNNFVAGQWARFAPADAAAWVMSQPDGPERNQALIGLGESWSDVDPAAAAAFAAKLPEGESRALAMRQAVAKWVEADPLAARRWVVQTDQYQDFDAAVEAIATQNNFMSREPARAMGWATGIFDDQLRAQTMSTILFNWFPLDRAAATAYLQSSPEFTPAQRADLLQKLEPSG